MKISDPKRPIPQALSRQAVLWQILAFVAVLTPHLGRLPLWIGFLALAGIGARLMIHLGRWSFPHWGVKLLLILASGIGLLLSFRAETGVRGTVAMLVVALSLKLLEIHRQRDAMVLILVAAFLAATVFLFDQEIFVAFYVLCSLAVVIAALVSIHQNPRETELLRPLRRSLRLLLPALPLMLVLFLFFPRFAPLWSVRLQQSTAKNGFTETVSPGDVGNLTRSAETVFRVVFDQGAPPPSAQRYWRGLVYPEFDGTNWSLGKNQAGLPEPLQAKGPNISYQIIQEPGDRPWLFALDLPLEAPEGQFLTRFRTLIAQKPLRQRLHYRLSSHLSGRLGPEADSTDPSRYTELPASGNPRSLALAAQWWQEAGGKPEAYLDRILKHFGGEFSYSLEPGPMGPQWVDTFLFDKRRGFCEHFAGSLAFMARAAGIPARLVGGYQGGEWNPLQNYFLIRQYDAHAWVEVWLPERGWLRIDPTAAVAPERIEQNAAQALADQPGFMADAPFTAFGLRNAGLLGQVRLRYEAVAFAWDRWVLNYHRQQEELLKRRLGEAGRRNLLTGLVFGIALLLFGTICWWQMKGPQGKAGNQNPAYRTLHRLFLALNRAGLPRKPEESVQAYCHRLAETKPELAEHFHKIARLDEALRYGQAPSPEHEARLLAAIRLCRRTLSKK